MNPEVALLDSTLQRAATVLRAGGVVAFPTETYYGLAVDPFNEQAIERIYRIKQRPQALPLLLLVENVHQLSQVALSIPHIYQELMRQFWPGSLSLVFPAHNQCSSKLTGDTGTIAVRQSPHPVAQRLLAVFGGPITATSANISGQPAAVTAQEVAQIFGEQLDLIVDGGATPGGQGSTLVGLQSGALCCLRPGKVDFSLVQAIGEAYNQAIT